jgi:RHS repeat-associated protein
LNQYTKRNNINAAYDNDGNLTTGVDGSSYVYDAQNRLTSASGSGTTETFAYDGLNRQVSRTINGVTTYNVWDGWDLIIEYQGSTATAARVYGAGGGLVTDLNQNCYYQDGSGSTSHLADSSGHLLEWYRYDLQGAPIFYNFANTQQPASSYGVRHLFTGQQWYSELGLYDLRNRFYSPQIGRFLQTDPSGFSGDPTNLYRYCGNNPMTLADPSGQYAIVNVSGNNVRITIPITYSWGTPQSTITAFNQGIESLWTGQFGSYNVTTTVADGSGYLTTNYVQVVPTSGISYVYGGSYGVWYSGGPSSLQLTGAFEAGHFMGLPDHFVLDENGNPIPNPAGYVGAMSQVGGTPSQADIDAIIQANQEPTSFLGRVWNAIKHLFGGTGSAPVAAVHSRRAT